MRYHVVVFITYLDIQTGATGVSNGPRVNDGTGWVATKFFRCTVKTIMIVYLVAFTAFKQPFTYPRVYVRDVCMP